VGSEVRFLSAAPFLFRSAMTWRPAREAGPEGVGRVINVKSLSGDAGHEAPWFHAGHM